MKKIAIDLHMINDKSGGDESYYTNLFSNFDASDLDIYVLAYSHVNLDFIPFKFTRIDLKYTNRIARYYFEIPRIVKKYEIDLLHTQYYIPNIRKVKKIVTIFDISYEHFGKMFSVKEKYLQKIFIRRAAKKADNIITISEFSKKDISKTYKVKADNIHVLYGAPKKGNLETTNLAFLKQKFEFDGDYMLCVGNLQPRKNIPRLIESYEKAYMQNNEIPKLVIVGKKAWKYDEIFASLGKSDIKDNIIITGYVTEAELACFYQNARFFIYPSIFEGFGLPIIEAMSYGIPVGTSNTSSMVEIANEQTVLFNPYDIDQIKNTILQLSEKEMSGEEIEKLIAYSQTFNWKTTADKLRDIYKELLNQ